MVPVKSIDFRSRDNVARNAVVYHLVFDIYIGPPSSAGISGDGYRQVVVEANSFGI